MVQYAPLAQGSESPNTQEIDHNNSATEYDLFLEKFLRLPPQKPLYRQHFKCIVIHLTLCALNFLSCLAVWSWSAKDCPFGVYGPNLVYSKLKYQKRISKLMTSCVAPAKAAIAYESQRWDSTNTFFRNGTVNPNRLHKEYAHTL